MEESNQHTDNKKYKFKELKVYASTEWLADNKKKYRQVFDRFELSYVYAELAFYNKQFDRGSWEVEVEIKCYELRKSNKQICALNFKKKVSKFDNIVYIREGWGNKKKGVFWKKGTYFWEVWIDGEKAGTKYFYVLDSGSEWDQKDNPYLSISSLKLYEGQYDDVNEDDRIYMRSFSTEETRYVYTEISMKNQFFEVDWHAELFVKFYNEARELKGQINKLRKVKANEDEVSITAGWGSNIKGSWRVGDYTAEVIFMDHLLAVIPFEVGYEFELGNPSVKLPSKDSNFVLLEDENIEQQSFEELMKRLDDMIGLQEIKQQIRDHASYIRFLQLRKDKGFEEQEDINVHAVFTGNPGTGKTTVANMMGALYKKMGLLTKGHVHVVDRVDLVGEYIGQTAPKVKEAIEKARGGVLFIDEAYALARANDDSKDFGREVIEILVKEMSNGKGDLAVIVAGYPKAMKHFIDSNPGLKSRFKHYFEFRDYMPSELSQIAEYASAYKGVQIDETAKERMDEIIVEAFRNRDDQFGNARYVFDLVEKAKVNFGLRIMAKDNPEKLDDETLNTILVEDVERIKTSKDKKLPGIPEDRDLLASSLEELDALIGIENIKTQIHELVDIVKFHRNTGKDVLQSFYMHTVFVGNPGTGKTTVARILTQIYKALGLLERGHIVETDRQGLVAGYVGQTAIKTAERIDEAMGGVLFIDEAYALSNQGTHQGDFGNEAIQTLLKRMEDHRGEFFVFAAGYPDNMDKFLKVNPGLHSRFDKFLRFEDYSPSELSEIGIQMINDQGYQLEQKAVVLFSDHLADVHAKRDKFFGNARAVRKLILELIKIQNLRLAKRENQKIQKKIASRIIIQDVMDLIKSGDETLFERATIGFN